MAGIKTRVTDDGDKRFVGGQSRLRRHPTSSRTQE